MYLLLVAAAAAAAAHVYRRERHNQMIIRLQHRDILRAPKLVIIANSLEANRAIVKYAKVRHRLPYSPRTFLHTCQLTSSARDQLTCAQSSCDIDYSTVTARKAHRDIDDKKPCTRKHRVQLMSVHNELDATRPSRPRPTRGTTACSWYCRAEISWMTRVSSAAAAAAAAVVATRMTTKFPASGTPSDSNSTAVRSRISYRGCKRSVNFEYKRYCEFFKEMVLSPLRLFKNYSSYS
uniref:Secreted protein n=1 Tax=Trichogramma kaykai TaxID=54128 RepID=A0ABD2WXS5_9HYME